MINTIFYKQAELLLRILPLVYQEKVFALKGGTAINFSVREGQVGIGEGHGGEDPYEKSTI
jgi:hypothetical protein